MFPQGILIKKNDFNELKGLHPSWEADVSSRSPYENVQIAGEEYLNSSSGEATFVMTPSCETTMTFSRKLVEQGALGEWGGVVAGVQTGGRGQLRRPWASLPGNLHTSIVLPAPPSSGPWKEALTDLLPLVCGYVITNVLEEFGCHLQLKWPNDLLLDGKKVGGMIIEEKNGTSILGLGINLVDRPAKAQMREDHSVPAGKIVLSSFIGGAMTLAEALVSRGKNVYIAMLDEIPPSRFLQLLERRLAWMGQPVLVGDGAYTPYEAVVSGLSSRGGLVIRHSGKDTVLYSGTIIPL